MLIDPAKIDNARVLDAFMTLLVPALNALGERVTALEAEVRTLRGVSVEPAPVAVHSAPAPAPVVVPPPLPPPPAPAAVEEDEEDEDEDLDTPISLPLPRKLEGIKRIRGK